VAAPADLGQQRAEDDRGPSPRAHEGHPAERVLTAADAVGLPGHHPECRLTTQMLLPFIF
jgi:hypothetical protein